MDPKTRSQVIASLRAAAAKLSATETRTDKNVDSLAQDLAALTQENDHTEARLQLAEALHNKKWMNILKALETMNSAYGYLPPGGRQIQTEALEALLEQVENQWGPEAAKKLYMAF